MTRKRSRKRQNSFKKAEKSAVVKERIKLEGVLDKMFLRTILRVEMLSLEVYSKTKELTKTMQGASWKEGSPNVDTSQKLKGQEREIIGCATRLVQVRSL